MATETARNCAYPPWIAFAVNPIYCFLFCVTIERFDESRIKDPLTHAIIGAVFQVASWVGPGVLESAYQDCLEIELTTANLHFRRQPTLPFVYRGVRIHHGFRPDLIIEQKVIVEVKAVKAFQPNHEAQLLTYLRLSGIHVGLMINFHEHPILKGIRRMVL